VYNKDASPELTKAFKTYAKKWLTDFGTVYRRDATDMVSWCRYVQDLSAELDREFGGALNGGHVKLGITQKMISLYLKYLWLLGDSDKKPAFAVVDRGIMEEAGVVNPPNWTELDDIEEYRRIVRHIDAFAVERGKVDGAEWEAAFWSADE
jgi:hypothetical protein